MKSAIEAVLGGELVNQNPDMGEEYWKLREVIQGKETALLELIKDNEAALKAFEDYTEAEGESTGIEVIVFYKQGFRNGFRLAIDALDED